MGGSILAGLRGHTPGRTMDRFVNTPPEQLVAHFMEELARGTTPLLLADYLENSLPRSWLARKLLGERRHEVRAIEPFPDRGFFVHSRIVRLITSSGLLEGRILPSGGSFGLFSISPGGPDGFRYLQRRPAHLSAVLAYEARPLTNDHAEMLASLIAEALGRQGNYSHHVLRTPDHLLDYGDEPDRRYYEVDPDELRRVRPALIAPTVRDAADGGWTLAYCTLYGWMHNVGTLIRHEHRIAPDYRITSEQRTLSQRIFRRMPAFRY
jgi:hypothetical protein